LAELATGSRIIGYEVETLAGRGGMGVVYRAVQLDLGRPVALKLISPELAGDTLFRDRFKREARLAASIDHPNVIPVYEAGEANGTLFLSMRWVEGDDLDTLIRRGGGLEPERAARIVDQVGAALDAAHGRGLVHRDVKPANILVARGRVEHVYLTDFGLVKEMTPSSKLTRSGQLLGTIDYVAPEMIKGLPSDPRSDIYALGCVLFHCLVGRVPFDADSEVAKIYGHLNETPPPPTALVPGLAPELDEVVGRAMAKEPADRYLTAGDLGAAAIAAAAKPREETHAAATAVLVPKVDGRSSKVARLAVAGIAIVALAGAALAAGALRADKGSQAKRPRPLAPPDGSLVRTRQSSTLEVVKAGARFAVPHAQRRAFGYGRQPVRTVSTATLRGIPRVPREGSLFRSFGSTIVWTVVHGERRLTKAPRGADVAIVPGGGLDQIPLPPHRRKTSIALTAPPIVTAGRVFTLAATVRSSHGVPKGACVFFRVAGSRLKERANTPTRQARCEARLLTTNPQSVRYRAQFVGDRGWKDSTTATRAIPVLQR
jgi:hypothetical protein